MSSILFMNNCPHKSVALGQLLEIAFVCYIKGRDMGYQDIFIEWQELRILWNNYNQCISGFKKPNNTILPFEFVEAKTNVPVDKVVDISLPNSLFDGCIPIISRDGCGVGICSEYIHEYTKRSGMLPRIDYKKRSNKLNDKYVLFHYRKSTKDKQLYRNIEDIWYIKLIKYIRKNHDIKIYKIGEECQFDNMFDRVYPYFFYKMRKLFELCRDCSIYIGCPSGPWSIPLYFGIPLISMVNTGEQFKNEMKNYGGHLDDKQMIIMTKKENIKKMMYHIDNVIGE